MDVGMTKRKIICPVCGKVIRATANDGGWVTGFGHGVELVDYGWILYQQASNLCPAPPQTYRREDYLYEAGETPDV